MMRRRIALALALTLALTLTAAPAAAALDPMREGIMWTTQFTPPLDQLAQLTGDAHAEVARLPIRWKNVQRGPGKPFDFSRYDPYVEALARNGVTVVANLHGTPKWAAETTAGGQPIERRPPVAAFQDDWRRYARQVVRRYGPGGTLWQERGVAGEPLPYHPIREYEIWNEPNLAENWTGGRRDPKSYAAFLIDTAEAIRAERGDTRILGISLCHCGVSPMSYTQRVLAVPGAREAMNAIAYHTYRAGPRGHVAAANGLRDAIDGAGYPNLEMHLTEFGWGTCEHLRVEVCVSPERQAELVTDTYRRFEANSLRLRLEAAHWFLLTDLCDREACGSHFQHMGLLSRSGQEKPSWSAYRAWARAH